MNVLKAILPERLPTQTQVLANYPNPFNPESWIPFQLAQDSTVTAKIYDLTGKQIRMIELGHLPAGNYVESKIGQFIGMVGLILESKYLQEHISIKSRLEIIQKLERW